MRHRYYYRPDRLVRFSADVPMGEIRVNEDWVALDEPEHLGQGDSIQTRSRVYGLVRELDRAAEIARGEHMDGVPFSVLDYPDAVPDFDAPSKPR